MSRYNVLLWDKDNNLYEVVINTDDRMIAETVASSVNRFVHQDRLLSMNNREPFDAVFIEDQMYKENNMEYIKCEGNK